MFTNMFSSSKRNAKKNLATYEAFCSESELEQISEILEKKECGVSFSSFGITQKLVIDKKYPVLHPLKEDIVDLDFIDTINSMAKTHVKKLIYADIAQNASARFQVFFDTKPEILDVLLHQFFSVDPFHVLLVADKLCYAATLVEILHEIHPHNALTKAADIIEKKSHLEPTFEKQKLTDDGLLAQLDNGLLTILNFEKLQDEHLAPIKTAIDTKALTYTVDKKKFKLPANVSILGFSVPNTAHFVGKAAGLYRQQMPVPAEVQEMFHMVVCVRCRQEGCLAPLTYSEVDLEFVQDYVSYAMQIAVSFPKSFEKHVVNWHKLVTKDAKKYIAPITPKLAITLIRYSVAHARMHLRDEVTIDDLKHSMDFIQDSLGLFEY